MPTVFTHSLIGFTAASVARSGPVGPTRRRFILLAMTLAVVPGVDGLPYLLGLIPNLHLLGHRGMTHSLAAAVLLGALAATCMTRPTPSVDRIWLRYWMFFTAVIASHGLLDMATNGGSGIAILAPFTEERFFWPVRSISVSPIRPARLFTPFGARAIVSEVLTVWTICGAVLLMTSVRRAGGPAFAGAPLHWFTSAALMGIALMAWLAYASQARLPA